MTSSCASAPRSAMTALPATERPSRRDLLRWRPLLEAFDPGFELAVRPLRVLREFIVEIVEPLFHLGAKPVHFRLDSGEVGLGRHLSTDLGDCVEDILQGRLGHQRHSNEPPRDDARKLPRGPWEARAAPVIAIDGGKRGRR